jgi:hypothetical protein
VVGDNRLKREVRVLVMKACIERRGLKLDMERRE